MNDLYSRALILGAFLIGILAVGGVALLVGLAVRKGRESEDHFDVGVKKDDTVKVSLPWRGKKKRKTVPPPPQQVNGPVAATDPETSLLDDVSTPFGVVGEVGEDPGLGMPLAVSELDTPPVPVPVFFEDPEPSPVELMDMVEHPVGEVGIEPVPVTSDLTDEKPDAFVEEMEPEREAPLPSPSPVAGDDTEARILPTKKPSIKVRRHDAVEQLPPVPDGTSGPAPFTVENSTEESW